MATVKQIEEQRKLRGQAPETLESFDKEVKQVLRDEEYAESLGKSLDFDRVFIQPAKLRIRQARNTRIEDLYVEGTDNLDDISAKVARKVVYNQGYIDGILSVLGDMIE